MTRITFQIPSARGERVTHSVVRDVVLPDGAGTLALVTLDNGLDHKPNTLGPLGMAELRERLAALRERAARGELAAIAVTGKPDGLAAGADLLGVGAVATREEAVALGRLGHATFGLLHDVPGGPAGARSEASTPVGKGAGVPTFAFVGGLALGGGLEVALHCDYRTVSADAALALPETSLGLVPGWGGAYLVPRLIGIEKAVEAVLDRPAQHRPYTAAEALALGLVDALFDAAGFLDRSLAWAARVLRGDVVVRRRPPDPEPLWDGVVAAARHRLDAVVAGSRPAPYRALDLLAAARTATRAAAFAAEDEALADLIMTDELRASVYAFSLVSGGRSSERPPEAAPEGKPEGPPVGATPDPALARPVTRVGVVGAGLMAAQIALLVAQRLGVPVVMRDLDAERVAKGLRSVRSAVERLVARGHLDADDAARVVASISGTTDLAELARCDLVVEAVTEDLSLKQRVFAELETVCGPKTVFATNTSALSVTAMAAGLRRPERVVGLHFFNPVARMALVEVVRAGQTSPETLATACAVAGRLRKTAVLVADRPGFVVNRLLVLVMGTVVEAVENGTPVEVADRALAPLGLPMPAFGLFDLVGPAVGLHVLTSLREDLGERFPASPGLARLVADGARLVLDPPAPGLPKPVDPAIQAAFGPPLATGATGRRGTPVLDDDGVLDAVLTALTAEIGHLLAEGVVAGPPQVDLCLILGAGWGFHTGGITPYLDRTGYSERVLGRRLLPDGVANAPA